MNGPVCVCVCVCSCLQYRYLSLDSFPSISGNDANCVNDNHLPRPCPTERVTPRHPDMAVCSGYDVRDEQCWCRVIFFFFLIQEVGTKAVNLYSLFFSAADQRGDARAPAVCRRTRSGCRIFQRGRITPNSVRRCEHAGSSNTPAPRHSAALQVQVRRRADLRGFLLNQCLHFSLL